MSLISFILNLMEYLVICLSALVASGLTLFSGFGLGTILLPVFAIFFPIDVAVALTAIVHLLNNFFKLMLLGKHADKNIDKIRFPSYSSCFYGGVVFGIAVGNETHSHL